MVAIFKIVSQKYQLIRFDQRGNGLSDWEVENISEDSMIADMQAIVDSTKISDFSIFGMSQGCAFAIRYAIEHTDQVRCLILFGGYIVGRLKRDSDEGKNRHDIGMKIIESGWGSNTPIYRNVFTSAILPDALSKNLAVLMNCNAYVQILRMRCVSKK